MHMYKSLMFLSNLNSMEEYKFVNIRILVICCEKYQRTVSVSVNHMFNRRCMLNINTCP
uniref:Uncharacterized protein n=1 Tax=Anguilla anguilla TaxID=7936 RepID=A0A0E9WRX2_ANGAN